MKIVQSYDEAAMPSKAVIFTRTSSKSPTTGVQVFSDWSARTTELTKCRLIRDQAQVHRLVGETIRSQATGVVALPIGTIIEERDELEVTTLIQYGSGETEELVERFEVVGSTPRPGSFSTSLLVPVREAKNG